MAAKKHSFIILAYQKSPFLEECIQSLLQQTRPSPILIATPTPNTHITRLAKKYQLTVKANPQQHGMAADFSFGLSQATTPYVTLAHQDDLYLPRYTEVMLENLEHYPDFLIKFSDYQEIIQADHEGIVHSWTANLLIKRFLIFLGFGLSSAISSPVSKRNLLRFGSPIPCPSVLFNRQHLQNFVFNSDFNINMDWDAWIKLAERKGEFLRTNQKLMRHRLHPASATSLGIKNERRQKEDLICFAKLWPTLLVRPLAKLYSLSYIGNKTD